MIDTAIPDVHSDGLINFDKRRKEFEVLAQIKLLQGAANAYHIETDRRFNQWFETVFTKKKQTVLTTVRTTPLPRRLQVLPDHK
jgi:hypothetical protein